MKISNAMSDIMTLLLTKDFEDKVTKYAIMKSTKLTFPWVREVVEDLKKQGLIEAKVIGTAPGKQPMMAYALTLEGIFTIFYEIPEIWNRIDEIAEKHVRLLPLIFGKWDRLAQPELKEFFVRGLKAAFEVSTLRFTGQVRTIDGEPILQKRSTEDYRLSIYWLVFSQMATLVKKEGSIGQKNALAKTIINDQELRAFAEVLFKELGTGNGAWASDYGSILEAVEQRNPKPFVSKGSALARFEKNQEARKEKIKNLMIKLEQNLWRRLNSIEKPKGGGEDEN